MKDNKRKATSPRPAAAEKEGKRPREMSPPRPTVQGAEADAGKREPGNGGKTKKGISMDDLRRRSRQLRRMENQVAGLRSSHRNEAEQEARQNPVGAAENFAASEIVRNFQRVVSAAMSEEAERRTARKPTTNTSSSTSANSTMTGPMSNSTPRGRPCGSDNCTR